MEELNHLAQFITSITFDTLTADVVERAKWLLREAVGVIIGGMGESEVGALAGYAVETAPGPVNLFAHNGQVNPAWSALVHGTVGTTLEMDEGHAFARGHAAIHAVPPALAMAQAKKASGREAVATTVVGYEVAARVGVGSQLRPKVHPFGASGCWRQRLLAPGLRSSQQRILPAHWSWRPRTLSCHLLRQGIKEGPCVILTPSH